MTARHCKRGRAAALVSGIVTSVLMTCSMVHAQSWLPDRNYTEGPGIKAGEFEIHPGVAVRAGYDSNVFVSDGRTNNTREISSGMLAVTPHLNISTRGKQREAGGEDTVTAPPKLRLRSGLAGNFIYYFADQTPDPNFEVDVDNELEIFPEGVVGAGLSASYQRTMRPFTEQGANNYIRNDVSVGTWLKFQSQGGVLSGRAGYRPDFSLFAADSGFSYLNNFTHTIPVNMAWKFLPHTAMLYDGEVALRDYRSDTEASHGVLFTDSRTLRSRLGLNGALTNTVALQVMVGAAFGFYQPTTLSDMGGEFQFDEYQEPIGQAVLSWTFGARNSALQLSYEHDVQASLVGAWVKRDRGEIGLTLNLLSMLALRFEVGGGRYDYGNMVGPDGTGLGVDNDDNRQDLRVDGAVRAEYRATNWLAFMVDATVTASDTDFVYDPDNTGLNVDPANFTKFEVFGGVRAHY